MKIAMIGQKGIPVRQGGIERHVEELSTRLAARGKNDVFVYVRPRLVSASGNTYKRVKLIPLPSVRTKHLEAITHTFLSTMHALTRVRPDVYHFHGVGPSLLSWMPRVFAPGARVVATFHCQDRFHKKWGAFARLVLRMGEWATVRFPHETIVVSRSLQLFCKRTYRKQVRYVPNGVSLKKTRKTDRVRALGLKPGEYVLSVSRLVRLKRVDDVIKAYHRMKTEKPLVIVGDARYSDDYVKSLQTLASGNRNIVFTGVQTGETLSQLFRNAALFVTASETEGLPIALLEAASVGVPIVGTGIPEHREALGDHGRLVRVGRIGDLTRAMDAELKKANGKRAREDRQELKKRVLKEYDWDAIAEDVLKAYERPRSEAGLAPDAKPVRA